jgi:LacI family transcriptional regulator
LNVYATSGNIVGMGGKARVALIVESSRAYGRGLLQGIASYARAHGPWSLYVEERLLTDPYPRWLDSWRGDGVIARVENREMERALRRTGLPVIDVRGTRDVDMPVLDTDNDAVVRLAVDHLCERGFRTLCYCGFGGLNYSELRKEAFCRYARALDLEFHVYESVATKEHELRDIERQGLFVEERLAEWLLSLPKPAGLMACNDIRGQQVINTCRELGIAVPEELSVVGVDNDEVLCEISEPPMSSVEPDTLRIGFEAARMLDRMMGGGPRGAVRFLVPPRGLVRRLSTNSFAVEDPDLARALSFIRRHATEPITVDDVARHAALSRRVLERRFREALACSPKEEMLRVRLERVKELLDETDWSLTAVALKAGFRHPEYMSVLFRNKIGMTPGQYRQRANGASSEREPALLPP